MKTGIITGVGNGIGYEITLNLLKKKFKIIGISKSKNKNVINLKQKYRNHFEFYQQDLSKKKDSNEKIKKILKKYKEINFLINNAGIRYRKSNLDSNFNTYQRVLDNNFFSAIIITNQYLKFLSKKNFSINSSIVNITSIVGPRGFSDLSNYAVSKSALEGYTKSLAIEYGDKNVRINCVAPGFIKSSYYSKFKTNKKLYDWTLERTPMKRWGEVNEVSHIIEFLISNKSSYITGNTIFVDGGWTAQ